VDTNVARVIRRAFVRGNDKRVWAVAEVLVPKSGKKAWRFNHAIMELRSSDLRRTQPSARNVL